MLVSGKIDFSTKNENIKDEKGDYAMIKEQIHKEDISMLNMYIPNKILGTSKYIKEPLIELQGGINKSIFPVWNFSIYLTTDKLSVTKYHQGQKTEWYN